MNPIRSIRFARSSALVALMALAALGTSGCADLTPCQRGTEGCVCDAPPANAIVGTCDGNLVCAKGRCIATEPPNGATVCYDTCGYRQNGDCDDGGPGAEFDDCGFGGDCSDCGARPNPCTNPAQPVFCPQTPTSCWPAATDCRSVRFCPGETTPIGCTTNLFVDCTQVPASRCVAMTLAGCDSPANAPCLEEMACIPFGAECNTLTDCPGLDAAVACYVGEMVVCDGANTTCR